MMDRRIVALLTIAAVVLGVLAGAWLYGAIS
jgi:hypothetical protein